MITCRQKAQTGLGPLKYQAILFCFYLREVDAGHFLQVIENLEVALRFAECDNACGLFRGNLQSRFEVFGRGLVDVNLPTRHEICDEVFEDRGSLFSCNVRLLLEHFRHFELPFLAGEVFAHGCRWGVTQTADADEGVFSRTLRQRFALRLRRRSGPREAATHKEGEDQGTEMFNPQSPIPNPHPKRQPLRRPSARIGIGDWGLNIGQISPRSRFPYAHSLVIKLPPVTVGRSARPLRMKVVFR